MWFDRSPERDWQVPFLLRAWASLLVPLKMRGQHFWNYFVSRKARCKILPLRVSGHVSSMIRTSIVEDCVEDDFGQWAKDEVTGEQGYVDDERIMFLDMGRHWVCLAVQTIWGPPAEKKKRKGKRKAQRYILKKRKSIRWRRTSTRSRNLVRRGLCLVVHRKQKQERLVKKARMAIRKVVFALTTQTKAQAKIITRTKAKEKTKEEKARKELILNPEFSASETPNEKGYGHAWESDDWSASHGTDDSWTSDTGWFCTKAHAAWMAVPLFESCLPSDTRGSWPWLHTADWIESGNRKIEEACMVLWYCDGIWPLYWVLRVRQLRDRNLHGKLHYPLSNDTTMFYQGWCAWDRWRAHLVFSLSDEKLGYDLWTGSKKRQDYVPSFWLVFFSS